MSQSPVLPRRLGRFLAAGTLVGIMVGSGIYRVPATVAGHVDGIIPYLAVWVLGGVLALAGALMFAEYTAMFPHTGGRYVYLREGVHPAAAFAYAVGNVLFLRPVSLGARALLLAGYVGVALPALASHEHLVAAGVILALTVVNVRSTRGGAGLAAWTAVAKVALLLILAVALLTFARPAGEVPAVARAVTGGWQGMGLALLSVMYTYSGWGSTTYLTGEVQDAPRTMPLVLSIGVSAVIGLFLFVNLGYLRAMPMDQLAASHAPAADAAATVLGGWGATLVSALVILSVFGSITGSMLTAPRLQFAMGADAPRLGFLARVHAAWGTPHVAIAMGSVLAITYLWNDTFDRLVEGYVLGSWPFYVLCAVGFFRLRRSRPGLERPWRVPGYPWVPGFFLLVATAMVANGFASDPLQAIRGSWVMLVGIPVWFLVKPRDDSR